jgi:hypothetical protein
MYTATFHKFYLLILWENREFKGFLLHKYLPQPDWTVCPSGWELRTNARACALADDVISSKPYIQVILLLLLLFCPVFDVAPSREENNTRLGTLSVFLLLLLFCCWRSLHLTPRVTWRLEVQAAVIGSASAIFQWACASQRAPKNRGPHCKQCCQRGQNKSLCINWYKTFKNINSLPLY